MEGYDDAAVAAEFGERLFKWGLFVREPKEFDCVVNGVFLGLLLMIWCLSLEG